MPSLGVYVCCEVLWPKDGCMRLQATVPIDSTMSSVSGKKGQDAVRRKPAATPSFVQALDGERPGSARVRIHGKTLVPVQRELARIISEANAEQARQSLSDLGAKVDVEKESKRPQGTKRRQSDQQRPRADKPTTVH